MDNWNRIVQEQHKNRIKRITLAAYSYSNFFFGKIKIKKNNLKWKSNDIGHQNDPILQIRSHGSKQLVKLKVCVLFFLHSYSMLVLI